MKKVITIILFCGSLFAMEDREKSVNAISQRFKKLYETAIDEYRALSLDVKKVNLECADVSTMLGKLQYELKNQNAYQSLEWFWRIKVRTQIDSEWLNKKQTKMLADLYIDLEQKVTKIQPEAIKKNDLSKLFKIEEYEAVSWLLKVVSNKKCSGLEWRALLADSTVENQYLLPTMLYQERLKKIILLYQSGKYGDDFVQELKEFDIK